MKILFLSPLERIGGRLLLEIKTLLKEGHAVRVVAWNTSGTEYHHDFPVTFVHSKNKESFLESMQKGLLTTLGKIIGGLYPRTFKEVMTSSWDVLHCCHLSLLPLAVLGKMLKGGRIVYDSYEFPIQNIPSKLKNQRLASLLGTALAIIEGLLLSGVDGVLTIPSVGDREKRKFAKRCKNLEVLLNVPSLEGIITKKTYSPYPTAVFVGGITWTKGLHVMLEATSLLTTPHPDFKLILIGPIYENYDEVVKKIANLGIRDNVVMYPRWTPLEEVSEILTSAWVGLWPSQPSARFSHITTGNSRKGFEYMKYGLPVVASSFGEIAKAVAEEQAGILVDATKPEALAQAIKEIIDNPVLRQQMAENGLAAVRQKYNWEKESVKLLNVYKALEDQNRAEVY